MDFNIRVRSTENHSVILELSGKLTAGEPALQVLECIQTQLSNGIKQIVLEVSAVTFFDSSAPGAILSSHTTLHSRGGSLKLEGLNARPIELIQKSRLETVLNVRSELPPRGRNIALRNFGIAVALLVVAAAFYWFRGR